MGNAIRCPSGFVPLQLQGCYVACPRDKGFVEFKKDNGPPSCAFQDSDGTIDETTTVIREQTPLLPPPPQSEQASAPVAPTLAQVNETNPDIFALYDAEQRRFNELIQVAMEKIGKQKIADAAFHRLQDAENAKDTAPEAYIAARNAYYTLTKGESWTSQEQRRVESAEIAPVLQKVLNEYTDAQDRLNKTAKLNESLSGFKERVGGVQDEFMGSVQLLGKQLQTVQQQLNLERHKTEQKKPLVLPFLGYILNALIIIASVFAIGSVVKALGTSGKPSFGRFGPRYYDEYH